MRNDFMFDGRLASDYNLAICNINANNNIETGVISNVSFTNFKSANSDTQYYIGSNYDYVLTKTFQVCKIEGCDAKFFTIDEVEKIQRWFCRDNGYYKFAFITDDCQDISYNAKININSIELCEDIIGLEFTVTTDSPYGYVNKIHTFNLIAGDTVVIKDNSSKTGSTLLNATLECNSSGNYKVKCDFNDTSNISEIKNCTEGEIIKISDMCVISSSIPSHDICNDFNYIFPKISNTISNNKNAFTVNLPCILTLEYKVKRKVGI